MHIFYQYSKGKFVYGSLPKPLTIYNLFQSLNFYKLQYFVLFFAASVINHMKSDYYNFNDYSPLLMLAILSLSSSHTYFKKNLARLAMLPYMGLIQKLPNY